MRKLLFILVLLCPSVLFSQSFKVNLSPRHEQKLGLVKSGHKRMMKYYKYHKRDSAKQSKERAKANKRELDSLRKANVNAEKLSAELDKRGIKGAEQISYADNVQKEVINLREVLNDSLASDSAKQEARTRIKTISKDKVNAALAESGHPYKADYLRAQKLNAELKQYLVIAKDSCATDSTSSIAKQKAKELAMQQAMKNPEFRGLYEHYKQNTQSPDWEVMGQQVPGLDSLQGIFDSSPEELMKSADSFSSQALMKESGLGDLANKTEAFEEVLAQQKQLADPEYLQKEGKEKAQEAAIDHFAEHADKLESAQQKMGGLLGKFREFTNTDGTVKGIKRTSLEGKTFKERIVLGGNFNIVSTEPVAIDISPLVGYRFNTKLYMGLSMNYRQTFGNVDSLNFNWYVSPTNTTFRAFANYDLIKSFFAYAEGEMGASKQKSSNPEVSKKWNTNYFIGLGKKFLIHPKLYMTITALYNLNNEKQNPTHPQRFQMRIGFQTSELAFRKKKIYYNP